MDPILSEATVDELVLELVGRSRAIVLSIAWMAQDEIGSDNVYTRHVSCGNQLECLGLVRLLDEHAIKTYKTKD